MTEDTLELTKNAAEITFKGNLRKKFYEYDEGLDVLLVEIAWQLNRIAGAQEVE